MALGVFGFCLICFTYILILSAICLLFLLKFRLEEKEKNGKNCKKINDSWSRKRAKSERDRLADKETTSMNHGADSSIALNCIRIW